MSWSFREPHTPGSELVAARESWEEVERDRPSWRWHECERGLPEQTVPVGGRQAIELAMSSSRGVTGSEQCLRKINLAVHRGWMAAERGWRQGDQPGGCRGHPGKK